MAARLTAEERLERLVAKCRARVDALDAPPTSLSHAPRSSLGALARDAGYERLSEQFCDVFSERLKARGLGTQPALSDPFNTRKTRIHL